MRFLLTSLMTYESEFYGAVGRELERRGHAVTHVTVSRQAARLLRGQDADARCLWDVSAALGEPASLEDEVRRIESAYPIPHLRDVYRNDRACAGRPEDRCIRRTVAHFRALERVFDDVRPDVVLPEVGNETIRVAAHLIALGARDPGALHPAHDLPEPDPRLRRHPPRADRPARGAPRADAGGGRGGRGVPPRVHGARARRSASTAASRSRRGG